MSAEIFISYHTETSSHITKAICNHLEAEGIRCWYAPRDVVGPYAGSIEKAINECSIFIVVINEKASKSHDVLSEINLVVERIRRNESVIILPFKVSNDNLSGNIKYYLGQEHWIDGVTPPMEERIKELTDKVKVCLEQNQHTNIMINQPVGLVNSLSYPDVRFIGRKQELEKISQQLSGGNNKLFLVGMGGIGKSEIAKQYLIDNMDNYSKIIWIPFNNNLSCTIGSDNLFPITGISRIDYPNDSDEKYSLRKMDILKKIADKSVLIIIDNFDVENDPYLDRFLSGSYTVIFTTRVYHNKKNEIKIEAIKDQNTLVELFLSEYTRAITSEDKTTIKKMIEYMNGHTLSIRLIAAAMQKNRISPEKMFQLLKKDSSNRQNKEQRVSEQIIDHLRTVFRLSALKKEEKNLLMNLSLFPNSGIEVVKFYEWCEYEDYELIDSLIARSWIIHDNIKDIVHLHPLISEIMLEELNKYPDVCNTMLANYYENFRWNIQYPVQKRIRINELSDTIYKRLPVNHLYRYNILMVRILGFHYLSQYQQSFESCSLLISSGINFEQKAFGYTKLCHGLTLSGYYEKALEVGKEGKKILQNIDISQCSHYEAYLYRNLLGHYAEALNHCGYSENAYKEFLYIYDKIDNKFYKNTKEETLGWTEFHLTQCLFKLSRYDEAEEMIQRSLTHFEQCHCDYGISFSLWNKSILLARKGEYDLAEQCIEKTLSILMSIIGKENVDIAKTYHYQSKIRVFAHDVQGTIESLEKAQKIYKKLNFVVYSSQVKDEINKIKSGQFWQPDIL